MSDVTVLTQEYKAASELAQLLSRVLIRLKKAYLGLTSSATSPEELAPERRELAKILSAIIDLLNPQEEPEVDVTMAARIPGSLVARLEKEHRGDLEYFLDDTSRVVTDLNSDAGRLSESDLRLLDEVTAAADAEASTVFRRLMRL
jgi:hypothetical protein